MFAAQPKSRSLTIAEGAVLGEVLEGGLAVGLAGLVVVDVVGEDRDVEGHGALRGSAKGPSGRGGGAGNTSKHGVRAEKQVGCGSTGKLGPGYVSFKAAGIARKATCKAPRG